MAADLLSRRSMLELAIRAAALPAGAQFFAAWSKAGQRHQHGGGSSAPPDPHLLRDYKPKFFAADDFEALQGITEILIPADDTPGAADAACATFIDFVLQAEADADYAAETRKHWRDAMVALKAAGFHSADKKGREAIVGAISLPERDPSAKHPAYFAYQLIKKENAFAFYTSREGMIEDLHYKGNSYNAFFPACTHPEHHVV
jgi:hypothetical protein